MQLTSAQLQTLKTDILANTNTVQFGQNTVQIRNLPNNQDGYAAIVAWYNLTHATWTVWKSLVSINSVGKTFNATELAGLTSANQTRLQTLAVYLADGVNPSVADVRAFFDDIFSGAGGANTRAALLVLWKRLATNAEKLFSTGTGSDASPATLSTTAEGKLTVAEVELARNLP